MKKVLYFCALSVLFLGGMFFSLPARAADTNNLVANYSLDQAGESGLPLGWNQGAWGENTSSFDVETDQTNYVKSLKIVLSNSISGDAKWYFDPVDVETGDYYYKDEYLSDAETSLVVQLQDSTGSISYEYLKSLPASSSWTEASVKIIVPSNITKITVFHLISSDGTLSTKNYSLTKIVSTVVTDNVPNNSLEGVSLLNPSSPDGWQYGGWGSNEVSYEYLEGIANSGNRAVKTTVSNYTDGDAKWYFDPQTIVAGKQYVFSDYYQSDVTSRVVLQFTKDDGTLSYLELKGAEPSVDWKNYTDNFLVPEGTREITVFHLLSSNGTLVTDDYQIIEIIPRMPTIADNVPNNSVEEIIDGMPIGWHTGNWGQNNAVFSVSENAHNDGKSIRIVLNDFVDGDAKWYFEPVTLDKIGEYTLSDFYRSDVLSDIYLVSDNGDGTYSYQFLETLPAASDWSKWQSKIAISDVSKKYTIFHLIKGNGFLETDDFSIVFFSQPENIIPNNSLEVFGSGGQSPEGWITDRWGSNDAIFTYESDGRNGGMCVKTTVTNYTSGDGKWLFSPVAVTAGQTYRFSDYYKSDIVSMVVVEIIKSNGSIDHLGLQNAGPSLEWRQYSDIFTVPVGCEMISILHLIAGVGYLVTDDYSLVVHQPIGFLEPIISLTFDDGWEENYNTALPVLSEYGFKTTQYYATTFIENSTETYKIDAFVQAGHEIGSHSVNHPYLTNLSPEQLELELGNSKALLETFAGVGNVANFATPYGEYNDTVLGSIMGNYDSTRNTDVGFNYPENFQIRNIRVQNLMNTTSIEEYQSWVDQAVLEKSWLVLVYHRIASDPGQFDTPVADFIPQMEIVKNSGAVVATISEALNLISNQVELSTIS